MTPRAACIATLLVATFAAPAAAQSGAEAHDGFMLRLTLGFGGGVATESYAGNETELSGLAGSFSFDAGGAVAENLVLHGRLSDMVIVDPTVSLNGTELGEANDTSLAFLLLGIGLTYYFMPANLYLTGVVGPSWAQLDVEGNDRGTSDTGFGLNLDVGKEWWASDDWGLGIAGRLWYSKVTESVVVGGINVGEADLDGVGFALLFSATYQ